MLRSHTGQHLLDHEGIIQKEIRRPIIHDKIGQSEESLGQQHMPLLLSLYGVQNSLKDTEHVGIVILLIVTIALRNAADRIEEDAHVAGIHCVGNQLEKAHHGSPRRRVSINHAERRIEQIGARRHRRLIEKATVHTLHKLLVHAGIVEETDPVVKEVGGRLLNGQNTIQVFKDARLIGKNCLVRGNRDISGLGRQQIA